MNEHATEILSRFAALDALLQTKGFPATSPWWHETVERWYRSGRRQIVPRVGRRGGKSSTLSRLGVVEALYGNHKIPPGDTGVVAIISTRREEAAERITTIKAILDAIEVAYTPWGEHGVRLVGRPIGFRVYTASVAGVSGFTGIFVFADEVAKWKDLDTGVNPATEVLRSVRPTMLTMPNARIVLSSSPVGKFDAHFDAYEEGETPLQVTAHAPSWIANPTVTEEDTHILEPDQSTWEREYAAIPQAEVAESLFSDAEIDKATRAEPEIVPREEGVTYEAAIDPATRTNAWTLAVGALRYTERGLQRSIVLAREWRRGTPSAIGVTDPETGALSPKKVLTQIKPLLDSYGIDCLTSDQASGDALRDVAADLGITLVLEPWTHSNKNSAYKNLQTWSRTDQLELAPVDHVKADLLGVRRKYTRNGTTIELLKSPDGRHSDHASSIALVASKLTVEPVIERTPTVDEQREAAKRERFQHFKIERERPHWDRRGAMSAYERERWGGLGRRR